jgi:hypothetical protein
MVLVGNTPPLHGRVRGSNPRRSTMTRDPLTREKFIEALDLALAKIDLKNMAKEKGALVNAHEAFGKIYEEVDEAGDEMRFNNDEAFCEEVIDIMVACAWAWASLKKDK